MRHYRYRTSVVLGRWFASREDAVADALRAGQAYVDPDDPRKVVLRTDVQIEESEASKSTAR